MANGSPIRENKRTFTTLREGHIREDTMNTTETTNPEAEKPTVPTIAVPIVAALLQILKSSPSLIRIAEMFAITDSEEKIKALTSTLHTMSSDADSKHIWPLIDAIMDAFTEEERILFLTHLDSPFRDKRLKFTVAMQIFRFHSFWKGDKEILSSYADCVATLLMQKEDVSTSSMASFWGVDPKGIEHKISTAAQNCFSFGGYGVVLFQMTMKKIAERSQLNSSWYTSSGSFINMFVGETGHKYFSSLKMANQIGFLGQISMTAEPKT